MFCLVYFYNNRMRPDINLLLLLIYYFIGLNIGLIVCSIVFLLVQLLFSQKNCITIFYILSRSYNAPYIFFFPKHKSILEFMDVVISRNCLLFL